MWVEKLRPRERKWFARVRENTAGKNLNESSFQCGPFLRLVSCLNGRQKTETEEPRKAQCGGQRFLFLKFQAFHNYFIQTQIPILLIPFPVSWLNISVCLGHYLDSKSQYWRIWCPCFCLLNIDLSRLWEHLFSVICKLRPILGLWVIALVPLICSVYPIFDL